jgi:hypothetical protein
MDPMVRILPAQIAGVVGFAFNYVCHHFSNRTAAALVSFVQELNLSLGIAGGAYIFMKMACRLVFSISERHGDRLDLQSDVKFKQTFYKDKNGARQRTIPLLHLPTINFNSSKYRPSQINGYNGACLVAELVQDWW